MKPIRTPEDHSALLAEIAALMDAKPGTPEADRLEILAVLASEYERRELPPESDPVDLLALVMRGKGLSQAELSEVLGPPLSSLCSKASFAVAKANSR